MNRCTFIGRLTKDPVSKSTSTGKTVVNFSIAINNGKDRDGKERPATFINLQAWERIAEIVEAYCSKGSQVCVTAILQNNNYEKDGKTVYSDNFIVRELELLGSKKDGQDSLTEQNSAKYQEMLDKKAEEEEQKALDAANKRAIEEGKKTAERYESPPEINVEDINVQMPF